jgi:molecular chaperone Hsp33
MSADTVRRFLLRGAPVRGEIVSLDQCWREVSRRHELPAPIPSILGELSAAAVLLAATLKFDGSLILQIHGDADIQLLVVEARSDGRIRATVKLRDQTPLIDPQANLGSLVNRHGRGRFAVTLDPGEAASGRQTWQGIVPFEGESVAEVLEHYMSRSEQLPTRLWLAADGQRASGILLQRLPDEGGHAAANGAPADPDSWNRMQHLAATITPAELLSIDSERMLTRLFHEESIVGFEPRPLRFGCGCTRDKVAGILRLLGREEIDSILAEQQAVEVRCDFCNEGYRFDPVDCAGLFIEPPPRPASPHHH